MNVPDNKLIMIAAGGTAGHLYPGLALGKELLGRGVRVHFVVRKGDSVIPLLNKYNVNFSEISVRGWNRLFGPGLIATLFLLVVSFFQSMSIIRKLRPSAVVGMGGYVSLPVVFGARILGKRILIHEQNFLPGMANRLLSSIARTIAVSFEDSLRFFNSSKTIYTGNPLRIDFKLMDRSNARKKLGLASESFVVFVFGGSQGAHSINKGILAALPALKNTENLSFIHITGTKDYETIKDAYRINGFSAVVYTFCFDISMLYSAADLVLSRSGAATINELMCAEKPAVLIPYPYATANHQMKNAEYLLQKNCVEIIKDTDLSGEVLGKTILEYIAVPDTLRTMRDNYKPLKEKLRAASSLLADAVLALL